MSNPFRFLDLPPELRLMMYENISMSIHYYVFGGPGIWAANPPCTISLIRRTLQVSILTSSKSIYAEAQTIFDTKFRELERTPIRVLMNYVDLCVADHIRSYTKFWLGLLLVPCQKFLDYMATVSDATHCIEIVLSPGTVPITRRTVILELRDLCRHIFSGDLAVRSVAVLHNGTLPVVEQDPTKATLATWKAARTGNAVTHPPTRREEELMEVTELSSAEWAALHDEISVLIKRCGPTQPWQHVPSQGYGMTMDWFVYLMESAYQTGVEWSVRQSSCI
jgi:hypothetical protein